MVTKINLSFKLMKSNYNNSFKVNSRHENSHTILSKYTI